MKPGSGHRGRITIASERKRREEKLEMEHPSRWLAADCGEVQPQP